MLVFRVRENAGPVGRKACFQGWRGALVRAVVLLRPASVRGLSGEQSFQSEVEGMPKVLILRTRWSVGQFQQEQQSRLRFVVVQR